MNMSSLILFFNDTSNTQIYTYLHTLSLHDALPSYLWRLRRDRGQRDLVPTEEEALSYTYTPAELMHVEMNRQRNVVGTPEQVKAQLVELGERSGVSEFGVLTIRTEERRDGQASVSTCRARWSP